MTDDSFPTEDAWADDEDAKTARFDVRRDMAGRVVLVPTFAPSELNAAEREFYESLQKTYPAYKRAIVKPEFVVDVEVGDSLTLDELREGFDEMIDNVRDALRGVADVLREADADAHREYQEVEDDG
jgi:hypothetical protein